EKALGTDHPDTLSSMSSLDWALRQQGKYDEADILHKRVGRKGMLLGGDHPGAPTTANNPDAAPHNQRTPDGAEITHKHAAEGREMMLLSGDSSIPPRFATTCGNLDNQKEQEEAGTKHQLALVGRDPVLGTPQADVLLSTDGPATA